MTLVAAAVLMASALGGGISAAPVDQRHQVPGRLPGVQPTLRNQDRQGGWAPWLQAAQRVPYSPDEGRAVAAGADLDAAFAAGYLDHGGPPVYLRHLLEDVGFCEGGAWGETPPSAYLSRFQFSPPTWRSAVAATGLADPNDAYHVGSNVAWLVLSTNPGGSGGWPTCWWRGSIP